MSGRLVRLALLALVAVLVPAPGGAVADSERKPPKKAPYTFVKQWVYADASDEPYAVAVAKNGDVYVAGEDAKLRRYNRNGRLKRTWALPFAVFGGMSFDPSGRLHIPDYFGQPANGIDGSVRVYSKNGEFQMSYAHPSANNFSPIDVVVDGAGNSYVADPVASTIYKFDPTTMAVSTVAGPGSASGQLDSPNDLALAPGGKLVVADHDNQRVQVLTRSGEFVKEWGQSGFGNGRFALGPTYVAVQGKRVLVADQGSKRIQVFTMKGKYKGTLSDRLRVNFNIAVGAKGVVYVAGYLASLDHGVAKFKRR